MAPSDPDFRTLVVAESIRLFGENGYESTTVEQIAAAAGISRRTFFRQFRAKEDVIFADSRWCRRCPRCAIGNS
jgi:AcrR family transcriptional regulator